MILRSSSSSEISLRREAPHRRQAAFTLVELLTVLAIIAIITAIALPSFQVIGARHFDASVNEISGIMEDARAYATAQNTHVWVAFYPINPASLNDGGGDDLCVVVYASSDGTEPITLGSSGQFSIPYTVAGTPTTISQILKVSTFKQIHLVTDGSLSAHIPSAPAASPSFPTSQPQFLLPLNGQGVTLGNQTLPSDAEAPAASLVEFTPSGSVQVSSSLPSMVEIDLQPTKGPGVIDQNNLAALRINGLTGLTTIYRN